MNTPRMNTRSPLASRFTRRSRAARLALPLLTAAAVLGGTQAHAQWLAAPATNAFGTSTNWTGGLINGTFSGPSTFTTLSVNANQQISTGGNIVFSGATTPGYTLGLSANAGSFQMFSGASIQMLAGVVADQTVNAGYYQSGGTSANKATVLTASSTTNRLILNGDHNNVNNSGSFTAGLSNYLNFGGALGLGTMNGIISNGKDTGGVAVLGNLIVKSTGTSSWTLNGVNTYTGGTEFGAGATGSFTLGNSAALSTGALRVINGGMNVSAGTALTGANAIANTINYVGGNATAVSNTYSAPTAGSNQITITVGTVTPAVGDLISGNLLGYFPNYTRVTAVSGTGVGAVLTLSNVAALTATAAQTGNTAAFNNAGAGTNTIFGSNAIEFSGTQNLTTTNSNLTAGTQTFNVTNTGLTTFSGVLQDASATAAAAIGSIVKTGAGTLALTNLNTYTGSTNVSAGTLRLDFSGNAAPTTATNIIRATSALTLAGGTLSIVGGGAGASNSQGFASTTLTANTASAFSVNSNGSTAVNATLGGLTRNAGSTVDFTVPTAGTITTTTTSASGATSGNLLVNSTGTGTAYATANGGTTFATNTLSGSQTIGALATFSTGNANYTSLNNVDVANGDAPASGSTANTLRFNAANVGLTLAGANTLRNGAVLVTPGSTGATISGGSLQPGSGTELVIHDYATLNVSSAITNNGATATLLTLTGPGTTTISGANTFTGNTSINSGTVRLGVSQVGTTSGAFGTGVGTTAIAAGATLDLSTFNLTIANAAVNVSATSTITSSAPAGSGGVLTYTGTGNAGITNALLTGTMGFLAVRANDNAGDLQLSNAGNNFSGGLTVRGTDAANVTGTIGAATFNPAGGLQNQTTINSVRGNSGTQLGTGTFTLDNGRLHWNGGYTIANNMVVAAGGGLLVADAAGGAVYTGTISGTGYLALSNGFTGRSTFQGSMGGFSGTLAVDTANVTSVDLAASATGSASMSLGFFGASATTGSVRWTGTGSPTIALGEVFTGTGSTTTAGLQGSTTAATTVTYAIGDNTANTPVFRGIIANGSGNAVTSVTAVTKVGSDTQTFSGASTYTGGTAINGGTLLVNNTTGSGTGTGPVTVGNGTTLNGTLGGSGTIALGALAANVVTVNSGSTLAPGNSPGLLTVTAGLAGGTTQGTATLNLQGGSIFSAEINGTTAGTLYDQVLLNGTGPTVAIAGNLTLTLGGGFTPAPTDTFVLVNNTNATTTGTLIGAFANAPFGTGTFTSNGYTFNVGTGDGNDVVLSGAQPIPEPGTWAMVVSGGLLLVSLQNRRRRRLAVG